jgi:hypothetical protein
MKKTLAILATVATVGATAVSAPAEAHRFGPAITAIRMTGPATPITALATAITAIRIGDTATGTATGK